MFGKRLKMLREEKEMSQDDLGRVLNVTQQTVNNYENAKRAPNLEMLCKIADFFEVSKDYLLEQSDDFRFQPKLNILSLFNLKSIEITAKKQQRIKKLLELSEDSQVDVEKIIDIFTQKDKARDEQAATGS
jgi:transcriptional regulator with XRE-family HTH domain